MNMPGFTAEASVFASANCYIARRSMSNNQEVITPAAINERCAAKAYRFAQRCRDSGVSSSPEGCVVASWDFYDFCVEYGL
jgi:hypothetical protein